MKVAIVGSRDFSSRRRVVDFVESLPDDTIIVSGGARGVDSWAETAALARGLQVEIHNAEWDKYGKRAGFVRNADIVNAADCVYAFWDGKSNGTAHSIDLARRAGKLMEVFS